MARLGMSREEAEKIRFFERCREWSDNHDSPDEMFLFDFFVDAFEAKYKQHSGEGVPHLSWEKDIKRQFGHARPIKKGRRADVPINKADWESYPSVKGRVEKEDQNAMSHSGLTQVVRLVRRIDKRSSFGKSKLWREANKLFAEATKTMAPQVAQVQLSAPEDKDGKDKDKIVLRAIATREPRKRPEKSREFEVLPWARDAYEALIEFIKQHGAKRAVLIQLAARESELLIEELSKQRGCEVTVFLSSPKLFRNYVKIQLQADFLGLRPQAVTDAFRRHDEERAKRLRIFIYDVPPSVCGVRIDDTLLMLSWYRYQYPHPHADPSDTGVILGHESAAILIRKGTHGFTELNNMFEKILNDYECHATKWTSDASRPSRPSTAEEIDD
jgi:hypothetical protein